MSKDDNIPNAVERATTQVTDGCRGIGFWAGNDRNELRIRLPIIPFLDMTSEIDHNQVKRFWDENAENRTRLAKADYNFYRNYLNMPSFFVMLPEVKGLSGLDIGCGEGHKPGCLQTLAQLKVDLPNSKIPIFTRTIIQWLNLLIKTGFALERI